MPKFVRTARGRKIDFDLLKVKAQIANVQKPIEVQKREEFVERRLRRKLKKAQRELAAKKKQTAAIETEPVKVEPTVKEKTQRRRIKRS